MAGNDVTIQLTAKDGASNTFKQVGREAQNMGKTIDTSAKTGEQSLSRLNKAGATTGAAFTALAGVLSIASHANAEAEASQARLTTAIENSGHSVLEYQDQLDAASKKALQLGFDDEDAADSIAKMTTATGDAQTAISDLSIAEDIARARKIDLASATNIVIAAEQGRTGALKRVGIEVDATMSKEQVMDALRSKFAGNAQAYSETTAAGYDRLKNATENAFEAIGSHLGPANELLLILPGLSAGFTGVGAAVGAMVPEFTAAAAGAAILDAALGPVGLAALAIGAVGAIFALSSVFNDSFTPAAKQAEGALQVLNDTIHYFEEQGSVIAPLAKQTGDNLEYINKAAGGFQDGLTKLTQTRDTALNSLNNYITAEGKSGQYYQEHVDDLANANAAIAQYISTQGQNKVAIDQTNAALTASNTILKDTGPAGDLARDTLTRLNKAQQDGTLFANKGETQWQSYVRQINELAANLPGMNQSMIQAGIDTKTTAAATAAGADANKEYTNSLTGYMQGLKVVGDQYETLDGQLGAVTKSTKEYKNAFTGIGQGKAIKGDQFTDMADGASAAGFALADETRAQNDANAAADAATQKLKDTEGAYYGVRDGVITLNEAHGIFKETQDGIIESQGPYNQQLSEYNSQLGYINDAVDILNQRKAAGIPLTKEEQGVLDGAASAQERLTGGTEDATVQLAIQAEQYAENMKQGDLLNQNTSDLNGTIQDLIVALQGIPGYVNTYINADTSDLAAGVAGAQAMLSTVDGKTVTTYVNVEFGHVAPGALGYQLGGMMPHAQLGRSLNSGWSWVGEAGPELTNGHMVLPATASRETARGSSGGGTHIHIANFNNYSNDARQFSDSMRSFNFGYGARS